MRMQNLSDATASLRVEIFRPAADAGRSIESDGERLGRRHLKGKRILVAESEPLVSIMIEDMLLDFGCVVAASAIDAADALALACDLPIDAAILDARLARPGSPSIAAVLGQRAIPYLIATAFGAPAASDAAGHLLKPYRPTDLRVALERLFS